MALTRRCRCGALVKGAYTCTACKQAADRARGTASQRGYDNDWRRIARIVLERDDWTCQINGPRCTRRATTADHIIPLAKGGARLDPANLQAACRPCNSGKRDR